MAVMAKEGGYTVVETGLAIAVSASLILLTVGLSIMVSNQRFRDTITTAQNFIQAQYNEVQSGINSRLGQSGSEGEGTSSVDRYIHCKSDSRAAGNSRSCYIVGRLITFNNDGSDADSGAIVSSYIVAKVKEGDEDNWPNQDLTGLENLQSDNVELRIINDLKGNMERGEHDAGLSPTVKKLGGNKVVGVWSINSGSVSFRQPGGRDLNKIANLALLRSPIDSSVIVVVNAPISSDLSIPDGPGVVAGYKLDINSSAAMINQGTDSLTAIGIKNGSTGYPGGLVCIDGGSNSAGISSNFNVDLDWGSPDNTDNNSKVRDGCTNWER